MSDIVSEPESEEVTVTEASNTTDEEPVRRVNREITSVSEKKELIVTGGNIATAANKMQVMIAVNKIGEYPQVSPSSIDAFDWTLDNIISTEKRSHFTIVFVHVQVPKTCIQDYISLFRSLMDTCWGHVAYRLVKSDADSVEKDVGCEEKVRQFQAYFEDKCRALEIEYDWFPNIRCYPEEAICGLVRSLQPDLLVLGHSRGLSGLKRLFETDVSEYCAKKAECNVVRIKPEEVTRGFLEGALVPVQNDDII